MQNKPYIFTCPGVCWVSGLALGLVIVILLGFGLFWGLLFGLILGAGVALSFQWAFCREDEKRQAHEAVAVAREGFAMVKAVTEVATEKVKAATEVAAETVSTGIANYTAKADAAKADAAAEKNETADQGDEGPKAKTTKVNAAKAEPTTPAATKPTPAAGRAAAADGKPEVLKAARGGKADNLKEIKGIGPKLEAMLHKMGVFHFDQISSWGAAEVAWVDANIEGFKGRATRDDWVAQAKILAAGGETEFSTRVGKGGVY